MIKIYVVVKEDDSRKEIVEAYNIESSAKNACEVLQSTSNWPNSDDWQYSYSEVSYYCVGEGI